MNEWIICSVRKDSGRITIAGTKVVDVFEAALMAADMNDLADKDFARRGEERESTFVPHLVIPMAASILEVHKVSPEQLAHYRNATSLNLLTRPSKTTVEEGGE